MAAVGFGVVRDQVTARISLEYFTTQYQVLLPNPTLPLTVSALGWGVLDTWFVGLVFGLALSAAARLGTRPTLTAAQFRRPIGTLLVGVGVCAAVAGIVGGLLATSGQIGLAPPKFDSVPTDRHVRFLVVVWVHRASVAASIVGGAGLIIWTWRRRSNVAAAV